MAKKAKATKKTKVVAATTKPGVRTGKPRTDARPANDKRAQPAKTREVGTKRVSALDAAATVLQKSGKPMRSRELINAMTEKGLWSSPGGKTPWATLYSSMIREISTDGKGSRFKKVDRGAFALNR